MAVLNKYLKVECWEFLDFFYIFADSSYNAKEILFRNGEFYGISLYLLQLFGLME